jgi:hypothetical protein
MAERTPKALASYEAAQTTERMPRQATMTGLAAQLRIIALLDGGVKGVHVYVDDFPHHELAKYYSRSKTSMNRKRVG